MDNEEKTNKFLTSKMGKKQWLAFIGIFLFIIVIVIAIGGDETEEEIEKSQISFSQQKITEISVKNVLENLSGTSVALKGNITKIELINLGATSEMLDSKIVNVYYKPKVWDEKSGMTTAVHTAIKTMEILFKNQNISKVAMWQQGDFTDKYGNTEIETATRIVMDKETADKIVSWDTVNERAWTDENSFFDLAELQYIHPAIRKEL